MASNHGYDMVGRMFEVLLNFFPGVQCASYSLVLNIRIEQAVALVAC